MKWWKYYGFMYENRKIRTIKIVLRIGEREDKGQ
jgi:hypothetical protein